MSEVFPQVSAVLLSYDCAEFIAEATRSVLAQDFEPLEVLISDDASEDDTFSILEREIENYRGPHRVGLRRRSSNSGSKSAHLNDVLPRVSGDIIVFFDGDDVAEPSRVRKIVDAFRRDPEVQAVYSAYSLIDRGGKTLGSGNVPHPPAGANTRAWFAKVDAFASGGALAVRRKTVDSFGPLDPDIHEDIVLPFRASLVGEVSYLDDELVRARRHPDSLTQTFDMFDSVERYRSRILWGIDRARKHRDSRLADIRTAEALMPNRVQELTGLREIVLDSLAAAEITAGLVSPSLWTRVRALFELFWEGAYREELPRNACLALSPNLYLRYKRQKLNSRRKQSRSAQQ
jgi:glycosyltransferase involved in cell wall biosynthesis